MTYLSKSREYFFIFDALIIGKGYVSFCYSPLPMYKGITPHDEDVSTDIIFQGLTLERSILV